MKMNREIYLKLRRIFELEVTEAVDDSDMYMNTDGDVDAGSSGFPVVAARSSDCDYSWCSGSSSICKEKEEKADVK